MTLETLRFDNSYATLPEAFFSRERPQPLADPKLADISPSAGRLLDLDEDQLARPELVEYCSGARELPGASPIATAYGGHQFGVWVPQLGDGRSILLGEVINKDGARWDLHLKGAGKTKYSRFGDGRAALRSSIREHLASEALHALGIPTTRSLCLIASSEMIQRESVEPAASLLRLAASHIRFGHFEYFALNNMRKELAMLLQYTIQRHFPEWEQEPNRYELLFENAVKQTARTIAMWQATGFVHGVMNTDNMSIIGDTLDYGPYCFLDEYIPEMVCNHSDRERRYAFDCQPIIGLWNCAALANAISTQVPEERLKAVMNTYTVNFQEHYLQQMRRRLGLNEDDSEEQKSADLQLINELRGLLAANHMDHAISMRSLADLDDARGGPLRDTCADLPGLERWAGRYLHRVGERSKDSARRDSMNAVNPCYLLRKHLAYLAIKKAERGDYSELRKLRALLQSPFTQQPDTADHFTAAAPDWSKNIALSCSA